MEHAVELRDTSWEHSVLRASGVVAVDFWAPWCGPCRRFGPIVDETAQAFAGRALVGKLNVDENETTAMRYQVRSIPTLLIFRDGRVVERRNGLVPKEELGALILSHLAPPNTPGDDSARESTSATDS